MNGKANNTALAAITLDVGTDLRVHILKPQSDASEEVSLESRHSLGHSGQGPLSKFMAAAQTSNA